MSERSYSRPWTQGIGHVDYVFRLLSQATGSMAPTGPVLGEGDPNGSYVSAVRGTSGVTGLTGVSGTYVVNTKDPFLAVVGRFASITIAGQAAGTWTYEFGTPLQNGDSTWSVPITIFSSGTATDLPAGSGLDMHLRFRNSQKLP